MFVENHEKHPLPLLNPGGVTCFRPHDGYGDQHVAPPGLMRGGENIPHFLQTYRSSGAKILHHLMTELRCEKHTSWWNAGERGISPALFFFPP